MVFTIMSHSKALDTAKQTISDTYSKRIKIWDRKYGDHTVELYSNSDRTKEANWVFETTGLARSPCGFYNNTTWHWRRFDCFIFQCAFIKIKRSVKDNASIWRNFNGTKSKTNKSLRFAKRKSLAGRTANVCSPCPPFPRSAFRGKRVPNKTLLQLERKTAVFPGKIRSPSERLINIKLVAITFLGPPRESLRGDVAVGAIREYCSRRVFTRQPPKARRRRNSELL